METAGCSDTLVPAWQTVCCTSMLQHLYIAVVHLADTYIALGTVAVFTYWAALQTGTLHFKFAGAKYRICFRDVSNGNWEKTNVMFPVVRNITPYRSFFFWLNLYGRLKKVSLWWRRMQFPADCSENANTDCSETVDRRYNCHKKCTEKWKPQQDTVFFKQV